MCNEITQRAAWKRYCEWMAAQRLPFPELDFESDGPELPLGSRKLTDPAAAIAATEGGSRLHVLPWGWPSPGRSRVYWVQAEKRRDPPNFRAIVPFETFFEYQALPPGAPKSTKKAKFEFSPAINEPMGMGAILRDGAWALVTCAPGPEVASVHDRQPTLIRLSDWARFLTDKAWPVDLVQPSPAGTLKALQLR
jgi:putative SOS response-associated peptidase YedK